MGVTDPAETYFQDGVWAWSATAEAWVQLQADASGYLKATGLTLPPGAATAANQVLLQTAIDTLVDVRHALHTVGIDELDVIVASSALPSGAATAAHQVTQNTALQLIDDLRNALHTVHTDELDVDVQASVLPTGAATAAHQVTQNTALQLIDDLRNALHTVGTDELDVHIDGQTSDVEIVQQAPADLTAALHGYIGAAWQKLPMLFGVSDTYAEVESEDDSAAGTNTLTCSTVPAGEVWLITNICAWNGTSPCTIINAVAWIDSTAHNLFREAGPAAGVAVNRQGWWVLSAGDYLTCGFSGCILNDNIRLHITGFKMDIDL